MLSALQTNFDETYPAGLAQPPTEKTAAVTGPGCNVGTFLLFFLPSSCPSVSLPLQSDGAEWSKGISSVL